MIYYLIWYNVTLYVELSKGDCPPTFTALHKDVLLKNTGGFSEWRRGCKLLETFFHALWKFLTHLCNSQILRVTYINTFFWYIHRGLILS